MEAPGFMRSTRYQQIEAQFRDLWLECKPLLTDDDNHHIHHYLEHGEPELAGETLGLALMLANARLPAAATRNPSTPLPLPDAPVVEPSVWRRVPARTERNRVVQVARIIRPLEVKRERIPIQPQKLPWHG